MTVKSLTNISEAELLNQVKVAVKMDGNDYNDATIQFWIDDTKHELLYAGVNADVIESTLAVGCIARGVDDKWISHLADYSEMFYKMAQRLKDVKVVS